MLHCKGNQDCPTLCIRYYLFTFHSNISPSSLLMSVLSSQSVSQAVHWRIECENLFWSTSSNNHTEFCQRSVSLENKSYMWIIRYLSKSHVLSVKSWFWINLTKVWPHSCVICNVSFDFSSDFQCTFTDGILYIHFLPNPWQVEQDLSMVTNLTRNSKIILCTQTGIL